MALLVLACLAAGVFPDRMAGFLVHARDQVLRPQELAAGPEASLARLGAFDAGTILAVAAVAGLLVYLTRRAAAGPTWGCGYAAPSPRMQYTGRSFAELLAERVYPRSLRPKVTRRAPEGLFPAPGSLTSDCPDPVTAKVYEPFFARWAARFLRLRVLQHGKVHVYLLYILVTIVLVLGWSSVRSWSWGAS
jgi:hydrogenase-4 component B